MLTDDEMLGLWLSRRAALAWFDAQGMGPVLAAYGVRLRPILAHYIATQRGLAEVELTALRACAERHGEADALAALLEW